MERDEGYSAVEYNKSTSKFFYYFLIVGLILGVIFYDFIQLKTGFSYIDEILALAFFLVTIVDKFVNKGGKIETYWFYIFGFWFFYLCYSYYLKSNLLEAIFQDAIVQLKPYIGFFCAYSLAPTLTQDQKRMIRKLCFISFFCLFFISFYMIDIMAHQSRFATATVVLATLLLYVSELNIRNITLYIIFLSLGLLSTRSKAYGYFFLSSSICIAYYNDVSFKIAIKPLLYTLTLLSTTIYLAWGKISYYFIYGLENYSSEELEFAFARPVLYLTSGQIFIDYFPFGSGFASFATYFSAIYYSTIYSEYNIDNVHGLSEDYPDFIADTFYPSLAQFGVAGIVLSLLFWIFMIRRIRLLSVPKINLSYLIILVSGIMFFAIESVADSTFTHNRGMYLLILMGASLANLEEAKE